MSDDEERASWEAQTARNLHGLELEQQGRQAEAAELYEQNVREGFQADWPYGRLVAIYERAGRPAEAIRVLEHGIAAFKGSTRRTPKIGGR